MASILSRPQCVKLHRRNTITTAAQEATMNLRANSSHESTNPDNANSAKQHHKTAYIFHGIYSTIAPSRGESRQQTDKIYFLQKTAWLWAPSMRGDVTIHRRLSMAELIPRMIAASYPHIHSLSTCTPTAAIVYWGDWIALVAPVIFATCLVLWQTHTKQTSTSCNINQKGIPIFLVHFSPFNFTDPAIKSFRNHDKIF